MPRRLPSARTVRRLTLPELRCHLEQVSLELAAIGGGYGVPHSELRRRALVLSRRTRELLERFPKEE